jgi:hypothetical protein
MPNSSLQDILKSGYNDNFSSEREFRERVVIKLLESLCWISKNDLVFEYPFQVGTQTVRVDYPVGTELYEKQE